MSREATDLKEIITAQARLQLHAFLESKTPLNLPRPSTPRVSILLVLYNRAELTLACLRSLRPRLEEAAAEILIVDNASRDETPALLDQLQGATVIRNADNRGFPAAVNQAAAAATGEFLLLLNNDTEVLDDSLDAAARFLRANREVGAVGGRIVLLDGTLQEAGCAIWREGHVYQHGRGDAPDAAEYQFQRDVDYCSGAFLMTPRELFQRMGGLDTTFSPGYFEDLDYCIRLWRAGWRVVYLPEIALRHFESASSTNKHNLNALYRRNHIVFTRKHADWLALQCPAKGTPRWWARSSHDDRFKVLYLPDAREAIPGVVRELRARNCFVTVYPVGDNANPADAESLPREVEVLPGGSLESLPRFLAERRHYYDCVLTADRAIAERVRQYQGKEGVAA